MTAVIVRLVHNATENVQPHTHSELHRRDVHACAKQCACVFVLSVDLKMPILVGKWRAPLLGVGVMGLAIYSRIGKSSVVHNEDYLGYEYSCALAEGHRWSSQGTLDVLVISTDPGCSCIPGCIHDVYPECDWKCTPTGPSRSTSRSWPPSVPKSRIAFGFRAALCSQTQCRPPSPTQEHCA